MNTPRYSAPLVQVPQSDGTFINKSFTLQKAHDYWAEKSRRDVKLYAEFMWEWELAPFHHEWYESLTQEKYSLIISPPEFGKTDTLLAVLSWHIGNHPWSTNSICSSTQEQASNRLTYLKGIFELERYKLVFPWIRSDPRKSWSKYAIDVTDSRLRYPEFIRQKQEFGNDQSHSCVAVSVGARSYNGTRISGYAIIDDPQDEKSAMSVRSREAVRDWYYGVYLSRLNPVTAKSAVIMTRWSEDDLAGTIVQQSPDAQKVTVTYAETTDSEGKRRATWEALRPLQYLDEVKGRMGRRRYEAYYLHKVGTLIGAMFDEEWLQSEIELSDDDPITHIVMSVDPSITKKSTSDYTAIAVCGYTKNKNFLLLNLIRQRMNSKDLSTVLQKVYTETVDEYGFCDVILIEQQGQQLLIIDKVLEDTNLPIRGVRYDGNKAQRATVLEAICSRNRFFAYWGYAWAKDFKNEIIEFPNGKFDDMVDAVAQGAIYLTLKGNRIKAKVRELAPGLMV